MAYSERLPKWGFSLLGVCFCTCVFSSQWEFISASVSEEKKNETKSDRYPLAVFDFQRVEMPFVTCLWVLIASLSKIGFHLHSKLHTVVPESCLLIVLGLIVGCILHFGRVARTSEYVLNADIFFIYLLPPIIFDAGYFMPVRSFFDNIGAVLLLAVMNTTLNTAFIGFSLWAVSYWGWIGRSISMLHCLIFSALISAVDPVAVISVFEEVHVNQMLYIIVFGESLLNDGVTVVLYHMMEGFIELGETNIIPIDVVTGIGSFFIIAIGGTVIGILFGLFGGFITKYTDHVKVIEPLLVFVLGYLMYLTSEMMHLSGILALSFGGIVLRHYLEHNVTKKTATTIKYFMKMLANISETVIFMFLGLSTIVDTLDWNLGFIFFAIFFCLIYRVIGVVILAWFLNKRRLVKLTKIDQFIMAYGGLRGGIAFCLALSLDEKLIPEKKLFVTATIIIVFFTVFIQGITIKPVVNALKVKRQPQNEPSLNVKIHEAFIDHLMAGIEDVTSRGGHNLMRTKFRRFNNKYLHPLLSKEKSKPKATKILNVYREVSEQDALKALKLKNSSTFHSTTDLHENPKRALLHNNLSYKQDIDDDSVQLQRAINAGKPRTVKWQTNRKNTIEDSTESIDRVVYHRRNGHKDDKLLTKGAWVQHQSRNSNGAALQSIVANVAVSDDVSSASEANVVTVTDSVQDMKSTVSSPVNSDHYISTHEDNISEKPLPWQESLNPSPTHLTDSIPNNEPIIAHVPSWVNNLSYSHITETGSPYVSPQTTVIPQVKQYHKTLYSLFAPHHDVPDTTMQKCVNSSDYFPNPWEQTNNEECPQISQKTDFRPEDLLLCSMHTEKAPEHHHVIVPTNFDSDEDSNKLAHLTEVASAPDFQHWRPIADPAQLQDSSRLQSDTMLSELAFQEGVKSRVQQWLIQVSDEEENDADEEDDGDGLDDAEKLEQELDVEMFIKH